MRLRDVPIPEPQEGEVSIRVGYSGVNPADSKTRAGHSAPVGYPVTLPFVTGRDAAGVVERTGENVTEFRQGDRVITWGSEDGKTWGSYAELVRVSVRNVAPMPQSLNFALGGNAPSESHLSTLDVSVINRPPTAHEVPGRVWNHTQPIARA